MPAGPPDRGAYAPASDVAGRHPQGRLLDLMPAGPPDRGAAVANPRPHQPPPGQPVLVQWRRHATVATTAVANPRPHQPPPGQPVLVQWRRHATVATTAVANRCLACNDVAGGRCGWRLLGGSVVSRELTARCLACNDVAGGRCGWRLLGGSVVSRELTARCLASAMDRDRHPLARRTLRQQRLRAHNCGPGLFGHGPRPSSARPTYLAAATTPCPQLRARTLRPWTDCRQPKPGANRDSPIRPRAHLCIGAPSPCRLSATQAWCKPGFTNSAPSTPVHRCPVPLPIVGGEQAIVGSRAAFSVDAHCRHLTPRESRHGRRAGHRRLARRIQRRRTLPPPDTSRVAPWSASRYSGCPDAGNWRRDRTIPAAILPTTSGRRRLLWMPGCRQLET